VKINTNRVCRYVQRKSNVVKYSAFVFLTVIVSTVLVHANVDAGTHQRSTSHQQVVQTSHLAAEKGQKFAPDSGFSPVTHVATATIVPTPTPAIAKRSIFVPAQIATPVPTPTPAPVPVSNAPVNSAPPASGGGGGDVTAIIDGVFGANAPEALQIARCESGLNPGARNPTSIGGSYATGLFQILYPSTWSTTPQAGLSPYDATANAQAAYAIFARDGYSWREWSCAA
jgi:hypothetical protein